MDRIGPLLHGSIRPGCPSSAGSREKGGAAEFDSYAQADAADRRIALRSERVRGIEPPSQAWEACVLPLNHTRWSALMVSTATGWRGTTDDRARVGAGRGSRTWYQ